MGSGLFFQEKKETHFKEIHHVQKHLRNAQLTDSITKKKEVIKEQCLISEVITWNVVLYFHMFSIVTAHTAVRLW